MTVHWPSSWLRVKTLSMDCSLKLTLKLHTPRHTNPPNYFPLWTSAATKGLRRRVKLKINTVWHQQATVSVDAVVFTSDAVFLSAGESNLLITQPPLLTSASECGDITVHLTSACYITSQIAECEQEDLSYVCWRVYQGFSVREQLQLLRRSVIRCWHIVFNSTKIPARYTAF